MTFAQIEFQLSVAPVPSLEAKNPSRHIRLNDVTMGFGHSVTPTPPPVHTVTSGPRSFGFKKPQRRFRSRPFLLHASHFQPAWRERWK